MMKISSKPRRSRARKSSRVSEAGVLAAFFKREFVPLQGNDGDSLGFFIPDRGIERQGDTPGNRSSHAAYAGMRRLAWMYRDSRNEAWALNIEMAMRALADRVKARPGVVAADVDQVFECLMTENCRCERCFSPALNASGSAAYGSAPVEIRFPMRAEEYAVRLGVPAHVVLLWCRKGKLPASVKDARTNCWWVYRAVSDLPRKKPVERG